MSTPPLADNLWLVGTASSEVFYVRGAILADALREAEKHVPTAIIGTVAFWSEMPPNTAPRLPQDFSGPMASAPSQDSGPDLPAGSKEGSK